MMVFEQAQVFGAMVVCGAVLGGVYDALGLLRRGAAVHACDLLFGVLAAAGMIGAALWLRADAFRLYAFAGVLTGFGLYMLTIGMMIRHVSRYILRNVKKREDLIKNVSDVAGKNRKGANV